MEENDESLHNFLYERNAKTLVEEKICFKTMTNPSCIDPLITDLPKQFCFLVRLDAFFIFLPGQVLLGQVFVVVSR